MKVDLGVLCYNESRNLSSILETIVKIKQDLPEVDLQVMVINNGSTDATEELLLEIEKEKNFVRHIKIPVNKGYGFGVRAGLAELTGDVVGFMWGDNQFDASILKTMIQAFLDNPSVQMAKTYRTKRYDGRSRLIVSKIYQIIFRLLYGIYTRDINSGPKLFRKNFFEKLLPLHSDDWFVDAELMIKTVRNCKPENVVEFPIIFYPRKFGKSNVKFSACFQFLFNLLKYKFIKI